MYGLFIRQNTNTKYLSWTLQYNDAKSRINEMTQKLQARLTLNIDDSHGIGR